MSDRFHSTDWYRVAKLTPRLRADVQVARHSYLGQTWLVLCNATSRKVHRLTPAAYAIAGRFDGATAIEDLWKGAVDELGNDAPTHQDILTLLTQLHQADLLDSRETPLLGEMLERRDKERRQVWKKLLLNPLSVTIPLFNPDRALRALAVGFSFLSPAGWWLIGLAIILTALVVLPSLWPALTDRGLDGFLDLENLLAIGAIYPVVKTLHEIGHGIAIRARGGTVPEIGVMLIAFFPIPYVEASSALMFPSKWSRAAVAASGIMIELVIASFALAVWAMSDPGLMRAMAFNTMMVSGFSTIAVNGNPLLKFDGYHVLCDLIEIPNLGQRATKWWGEVLRNRVLGTRERRRMALTTWERWWFFFYGPAAFAYRIAISVTIALFVATTYRAVGIALAVWSLTLSLIWPTLKTIKSALTDPRIRLAGFRAWRGAGVITLLAVGGLAVFPMPHYIVVQGVVWLPEEAFLRSPEDGIVIRQALSGAGPVEPDQTVFKISAPEIEAAYQQAEARLTAARYALARARLEDRGQVRQIEQDVDVLQQRIAELARRRSSLTVKTVSAGRLEIRGGEDLSGQFVAKGSLLAHVLPHDAPVVRAAVPQRHFRLLQEDPKEVEIRFAMAPFKAHRARVLGQVPQGEAVLPSAVLSLDGGGQFATTGGPEGLQTTTPVFVIDLEPTQTDIHPAYGMRVHIRFTLTPKPVVARVFGVVRQRILEEFDV